MSKRSSSKTPPKRPQGPSRADRLSPRGRPARGRKKTPAAPRRVSHTVAPAEAGRTVASLLHQHGEVSHRIAKGIIEAGLLTVDGEVARDPVHRPEAGARLQSQFNPGEKYGGPVRRLAGGAWFRVIVEDPAFVVVEKPAGLPTVPVGKRIGSSLVEKLLEAESPAVRERGLWVVHRIDRYVSGLVVVARERGALRELREQFAARTVRRDYIGICEGAPPEQEGKLAGYLREDPRTRKIVPADGPASGARAELQYRVAEALPHASLLEVRLITGRRNQIRVQFAAIGCPLVGDRSYGDHTPLLGRVALHAASLEFLHPRTREPVICESEPPEDFQAALERLRAGAHPHPEEQPARPAGREKGTRNVRPPRR